MQYSHCLLVIWYAMFKKIYSGSKTSTYLLQDGPVCISSLFPHTLWKFTPMQFTPFSENVKSVVKILWCTAYMVECIRYWISNWDVIIIYQSKMLPLGNQKQRVENHLLIFALWVQDTMFSTYKNSTWSRNRVDLAKKKGICLEEIKSEFCAKCWKMLVQEWNSR